MCIRDRYQRRVHGEKVHDEQIKKPLTSYFYFVKKRREELKVKFPGLSNKLLAVKMGEEWKCMGNAEKAIYEQQAKEDMERYQREKGVVEGKKSKGNAPKKPMTAYFYYVKGRRAALKAQQPSLTNTELITRMAEEWKGLSDFEKRTYVEMAQKDKERFGGEKASLAESQNQIPKPPKRPLSAYFCYLVERRPKLNKEFPAMAHIDILQKIGEEWNELSEEDKEPFNRKAADLREKYIKERKEYFDKYHPKVARKPQPESSDHSEDSDSQSQPNSSYPCLLYTSPSPRDLSTSRMPSSA
eukprot:TRINITY_DN6465_c0_g1_i4.p1 TRINITY_DN6465_c0_g1~~TRINITY_DN6465_c0_g1_i4.p1  ORF type:complete len:299 (-),score=71.71 TRINITY_DN6465_c0_g1_i4:22-918(-)